ncbi:MAG: aminopeptidase, partial [Idiomarinaceae bacterium]|nr:aminopeptidase [Idiomarinaceae bacterium]
DTETYKLDGGPTVAFGPNIHPAVYERLVAAAEAEEIPFQIEPIPGDTGTDGWAIQISRSGLPTGVLGIPLRYMHSSVETLAEKDVLRTGRLLAGFISRLDQEFSASMDGK